MIVRGKKEIEDDQKEIDQRDEEIFTSNFPKKKYFLPPDMYTYICVSGGKKCSFFGKFVLFCFFVTPVLRCTLLLYYQRIPRTMQNLCEVNNKNS